MKHARWKTKNRGKVDIDANTAHQSDATMIEPLAFLLLFVTLGGIGGVILTPGSTATGVLATALSAFIMLSIGRVTLVAALPSPLPRSIAVIVLSAIVGAWVVALFALMATPVVGIGFVQLTVTVGGAISAIVCYRQGRFFRGEALKSDFPLITGIVLAHYVLSSTVGTHIDLGGQLVFQRTAADHYY